MIGLAPLPADWAAAQRNSEVSRPSRATAMNAVRVSAKVPISRAASSLSCSSVLRYRAVRRIQKIIQVTKTTATIDIRPPKRSWASKLRLFEVKVSSAPNARLTARRRPATPSQIGRSRSRCPALTR